LKRDSALPSAIVSQVVDLYSYFAEERRIALESQVEFDRPIEVDREQIKRALANLVDNAIKYTPEGGKVGLEVRRADEEWVRFDVRDDGIGIPDGDRPQIWNRLFRGDKSRSQPGLGLGLSLAKAIVEAHQGRIGLESAQGQGSVFSIWLPTASITKM
jgi:signal transduction histidine kinase